MFDIEMKSDRGPICSCCRCASLISTVSSPLSELDIDHGYSEVLSLVISVVACSDELELSSVLSSLDDVEDCILLLVSNKIAATTTTRRTITTVAKPYTILRLCRIMALIYEYMRGIH